MTSFLLHNFELTNTLRKPQVQDQADFRVMKMFILTYQFHFSVDILSTVLLAIEQHVIDLINADILAVILSSKSFCVILLISM